MDRFKNISSERKNSGRVKLLSEMDSVNFKHNNIQFDVYRAKCKHFYKLLITVKVKLLNMSKKLN